MQIMADDPLNLVPWLEVRKTGVFVNGIKVVTGAGSLVNFFDFQPGVAPGAAATGIARLYMLTDNKLYLRVGVAAAEQVQSGTPITGGYYREFLSAGA